MPEKMREAAEAPERPAPAAPAAPVRTRWVVSNRDDDRVALWEPSDLHPQGQAWVAGRVPDEVALTPEVNLKLREEEIRLATPEEISKRQAQLATLEKPTAKGPWD